MRASSLRIYLVAVAALAILALAIAEGLRHPVAAPHSAEKLEAARLAALGQKALREERWGTDVIVDTVNDPNHTGLIGEEFTLITTDRGVLPAKLTSLNPNFAAVLVDYLRRAGFREGDVAAVGVTGSFPALNLAVLAAIETLGGRAVTITSLGASMWGANDPDFTWLDMERILEERGVLHSRSVAASLGGGEDRGRGLSPEGRRLLRRAAERNGVPFLELPTLEESIERRMEIYDSHRERRRYDVYVNVGGGLASLGASANGRLIRPGLNVGLGLHNFPRKGVIVRMAEQGVPVIHLLDILQLAEENGLPISPVPLPVPGEGEVFAREQYRWGGIVLVLVIYVGLASLLLFLGLRVSTRERK
jgi:poly-gamma-glutamate system protein